MSEILLGTCGWSYAEWEGILYPQKHSKLKQYSSICCTAEWLCEQSTMSVEASKKGIRCPLGPSIPHKILNPGVFITQLSFFKPA